MKTKIVSYFFDADKSNGFYKKCAEEMISRCKELGIDYIIEEKFYGNEWGLICDAKPTFLLEMYDRLKEPFLWLDIDTIILKTPDEVDSLTCDFASTLKKDEGLVNWMKENGVNVDTIQLIYDHAHYVSNTPKTKELLLKWQELCKKRINVFSYVSNSHNHLDFILKTNIIQNLKFEFLPESYKLGPVLKFVIHPEEKIKEELPMDKILPSHLGGHNDETYIDLDVLKYLTEKYKIGSAYDVGCGPGGMVKEMINRGIDCVGIDGDFTINSNFPLYVHDFSTGPIPNVLTRDFVWCNEFLEHVEEQYMNNYFDLFEKCKVIFCTACPITRGHHHVNVRLQEYWIDNFRKRNFTFHEDESIKIRSISVTPKEYIRISGMLFTNNRSL